MNALLNHAWGVSPASDRVWTQVTGMAPSRAVRRLLMVLQAFVDESSTDGSTYVLAGYVASAAVWAQFAKDWEELLPLATLGPNNTRRFKMSEMAMLDERMERVPAFYKVIERHDLIRLSCKINVADLERAKARISVQDNIPLHWGYIHNPYSMSFRCLMDMFHNYREKLNPLFPVGQKIDFTR
jgi:hypothetical protein